MDRELLKEEIENAKQLETPHIERKERNKLIKETIKYYGDGTGKLNLLIVVEELAELQEELIKYLDTNQFDIGLIEEAADVSIGLKCVKEIIFKDSWKDSLKEKTNEFYDKSKNETIINMIGWLSRLQQDIIKYLRQGETSKEIVDDYIKAKSVLKYLREYIIDEEDYRYARDVKYNRQHKRNKKNK